MRELYLVACCILFACSISAALHQAPLSSIVGFSITAAVCWLLGVIDSGA